MSLFDYYHAIPAPSAVLTYAQTLIAMAPTAYWRLGESSGNAADSSGNGYTLTAGGSPTYSAAGWANGGDTAITFDADWFTASDAAWMDIGTGDWSVSWCMKRSGTPATQMQILGHDGQGNAGEWAVQLYTSADVIRIRTDGVFSITHTATLYDDAWHHCVVSADRSGLATLYVDGAAVGSVDISSEVATDLTNARAIWLGARSAVPDLPFAGSLDEVALWNGTALSSTQVTTLYGAR